MVRVPAVVSSGRAFFNKLKSFSAEGWKTAYLVYQVVPCEHYGGGAIHFDVDMTALGA